MSKKKKIVLLVAMVAVLVIAAYVNILLLNKNNQDPDDGLTPTGSFYTQARADRQSTRDYELSLLNEIINTPGDEYAQARTNAITQKQKIIDIIETELLIETALKAQGYGDAIVSMSPNSNYIMITVELENDELAREDTAKIHYIVTSHVDVTDTNFIKILHT